MPRGGRSAELRRGRPATRADHAVTDRPPSEVHRLADERADARAAGDYAAADALRDQIAALGWEVRDTPSGSTLHPALPAAPASTGYARPEDLETLLGEPATVDLSLQLAAEDHAHDLRRLLAALAANPPPATWELVIVANQPSFDLDRLGSGLSIEPVLLHTAVRLGWADARNLGLRRSRGAVTVLLDTSVEPTGEFATPLLAAFDDPAVGIAGAWGLMSGDGRHFHDAPPGEVDAVTAYCLAIRREALRTVRGFDPRFHYYRNADLDLSFAVRAAGWRAIATEPLPLARHEHRGWVEVSDDERERLSRRNFYRFLKHWGDRRDLLLKPDPVRTPGRPRDR